MKTMITVKEYAERKGKSVQAVYKQMRAKENATLLENHIFLQKVGNKTAKVLDDEAVRILDEASRKIPTVIVQNGKDDIIESLRMENKQLLLKVADLQDQLLHEKDNVKLLQQEKIALLEEKEEKQEDQNQQPEEKETFWSRLWHRN